MPEIKVLPGAVSELIAAGEVIERPASIVKELVENAVDAGASTVTVELQNGGVRYLRVTDNGCGIPPAEAPVAFLRHATSKVRTAADLDAISTLGFRGEALASIAAVAHVEMLTRTHEAELGVLVKISGSELESVTEAGCPAGTTIVVRDVFYNVPARLKFLKKDVSEANAVQSILEKIALSHPEVSVKFIRDGRSVFHTPGDGRLQSAVYTVFGRDFSQNLLPVGYELGGVRVSGFISRPMFSRANRSMQHFFVNGRYTRTRTGAAALEEGFKSSIMTGKFPACVLTLAMPCDMVDVNVHPAKIEVRFVSEKSVFDAIYFAVKSAIAAGTRIAPEAGEARPDCPLEADISRPRSRCNPLTQFSGQEGEQQNILDAVQEPPLREDAPRPAAPMQSSVLRVSDAAPAYAVSRPAAVIVLPQEEKVPSPEAGPALPERGASPAEAPQPVRREQTHRIRVLGEIFQTYILAQIGETFALIDKHAAHERILYNRLKESQDGLERQYLLTLVTVTLSRTEHEEVLANLDALARLGFAVEDFGGNAVVLRAIPAVAAGAGPRELFLEAVECLSSKRQELPGAVEAILHRIACRSAVKGGDQNNMEELRRLVETVCADENVRFCPHGRPVILQYSRADLEKLFGRIQ